MKVFKFMFCALLGTALGPATAQDTFGDPLHIAFYASSESRSYGVLIEAPHNPNCPLQHYLIEGGRRPVVSRAVPQGGLRVVALGAGFARGERNLTVTAMGCAVAPITARRVIFGAQSPSHAWRLRPSALADVESHPLGQG